MPRPDLTGYILSMERGSTVGAALALGIGRLPKLHSPRSLWPTVARVPYGRKFRTSPGRTALLLRRDQGLRTERGCIDPAEALRPSLVLGRVPDRRCVGREVETREEKRGV